MTNKDKNEIFTMSNAKMGEAKGFIPTTLPIPIPYKEKEDKKD